jgi:hypothetical protein
MKLFPSESAKPVSQIGNRIRDHFDAASNAIVRNEEQLKKHI